MANPIIKIKRSAVAGKIPTTTSLELGELAINTYDGKVYIEQDQGAVGVGTTIIIINPWSVGLGSTAYNTYFTAGSVGIGTTNPTEPGLSVLGKVQIYQDSSSNNRIIFRGQPGSSYRWNIDNYSSSNQFRIFREDDATSANGSVAVSISTTGTVTATKFSGDGSLLTGITASGSGVVVQNQGSNVGTAGTLNFSTNLNATFASGTATISLSNNPSISGILTADQVYTSNNGNGTNIRIGDDAWLGDINVANTTRLSGAQDGTKGFIVFGNSDSVALGRTGTGPLYYGGNFTAAGIITASSFSGNATSATYAANAGIATYATSAGISTYASTAGVATALQNARTFSITGDVVASAISFDGTGNVSLAATIQPNSVGLGTDTTGDYVTNITGTSNQITVTSGTGEGSTPTLSIPNQFTVPQDLTVIRDVQINRNLNVNGNITIGGTSATLFTTELKVSDPDLVLGFRTDANNNDVSNDTTANHGGIAIASTEGSPLVSLYNPGIGESTAATYKKIMWFKSGSFTGLNTDAWLINYAVGIGSTQFPVGTRLAAGNVQFTQDDLAVVRNVNASGIITATTFNGTLNGNASSATYATSAGIATYATSAGIATYATSSGIATYATSAGIATYATTAGVSTYATTAGVSTSVIGGIASVSQLNVSGISTLTQISAGGTVGTAGSVLSSTGTGLSWIPAASGGGSTTRATSRSVATEGQTSFSITYTVGYIDVFLNGSKLDSTEYTASNGTTVVLNEGANVDDVLEFITFSNISLSSGTTIINDTTTNSIRYIPYTDAISGGISTLRVASTGLTFNPGTNTFTTGNIVGTQGNFSGIVTANSFRGDGSQLTGISAGGGTASIDLLEVILFA